MNESAAPDNKNQLHLALDLRIISLLLLAVVVAMLFLWKPWQSTTTSGRTVQVTGEAKLSDTPDEFVFNPSYEFKNANKDTALTELTAKSDTVVTGLKKLGVADKDIKTNSDSYNYPVYYGDSTTNVPTYNLQLTVKVTQKDLVQKVQDYLVGTTPSGAISPQTDFSDAKRKQLESKARNLATKDARVKADQMADNLGFKVDKVKSVSDGSGFGVMPYAASDMAISAGTASTSSLKVQPGQNDLNYSITVVYYIR